MGSSNANFVTALLVPEIYDCELYCTYIDVALVVIVHCVEWPHSSYTAGSAGSSSLWQSLDRLLGFFLINIQLYLIQFRNCVSLF